MKEFSVLPTSRQQRASALFPVKTSSLIRLFTEHCLAFFRWDGGGHSTSSCRAVWRCRSRSLRRTGAAVSSSDFSQQCFSVLQSPPSGICVVYVILQEMSHDVRMMVIYKKEKGVVVITNVERCLMICAKMPIGINHYPAEATCMDVPVWKTSQLFSWFKNCLISKALGCWYMNTGGIPGKLLTLVLLFCPWCVGFAWLFQGAGHFTALHI